MSDVFALLPQIVVDDTNKYLDVNFNAGGETSLTITTGTYANIVDLMAEVETQLQTVDADFDVYVFSNSAANMGKVYIRCSIIDSFVVLWKTGTHGSDNTDDHIGTVLGYDDSADTANAYAALAGNQHMYGWYPEKPPRVDEENRPELLGPASFRALSGKVTRTNIATHTIRDFEFVNIPRTKFLSAAASTNVAFEDFFEAAWAGTPFSVYKIEAADTDSDDWTDEGNYAIDTDGNPNMIDGHTRHAPGANFFSFGFRMVKQP